MKTMISTKRTRWVNLTLRITRLAWFALHLILLMLATFPHPSSQYLVLGGLLVACVVPQFYLRREDAKSRNLYPIIELVFSGTFLLYSCYLMEHYYSFIAIPALCAAVYSQEGRMRKHLLFGFAFLPFLAALISIPVREIAIGVLDGAFFFGLGYGVQRIWKTEQETQRLLEVNKRQNETLVQYAKQIERLTLLEERNRLARELHDTVGHTLTSVIMGMDAVSYLVESAPEQAKEKIDGLRNVMRKGLDEVRKHIHHIAPVQEQEPLSIQLKRVANEFALHSGTRIHFETVGAETSVPFPTTLTLTRCLQESLTNATRHGDAQQIQITLLTEAQRILLKIRDDGNGMEQLQYGFGLTVMKERLEALHGELLVQSAAGQGTMVICQLPLRMGRTGGSYERNDSSADCG